MRKENRMLWKYKRVLASLVAFVVVGAGLGFIYSRAYQPNAASLQSTSLGKPATHVEEQRITSSPGLIIQGEAYKITSPSTGANVLLFSPDGKNLLVGRPSSSKAPVDSQVLEVWDVQTRRKKFGRDIRESQTTWLPDGISQIIYSPDGKTVVTLHLNDKVHIWDSKHFKENHVIGQALKSSLQGHSIAAIGFSADGKLLLYLDDTSQIVKFDFKSRKPEVLMDVAPESIVVFSPAGSSIAVGSWSGSTLNLKLFSVTTGRQTRFISSYNNEPVIPIFSADGALLVVPTPDVLQVWDTTTVGPVTTLPRSGWAGESVTFSPSMPLLASDDGDGEIHIWNLQSPNQPMTIVTDNTEAKLAFSPDGRILAGGFENGVVTLWKLKPLKFADQKRNKP